MYNGFGQNVVLQRELVPDKVCKADTFGNFNWKEIAKNIPNGLAFCKECVK